LERSANRFADAMSEKLDVILLSIPWALDFFKIEHLADKGKLRNVGRNSCLTKRAIEPVDRSRWKISSPTKWAFANLELGKEIRDDHIACGLPSVRILLFLKMAEPEVKKAVRDHVGPFRWFCSTRAVKVDVT